MRMETLEPQLRVERMANGHYGLYCDKGLLREFSSLELLYLYRTCDPHQVLEEYHDKFCPGHSDKAKQMNRKPVKCLETGQVFDCINNAAYALNLNVNYCYKLVKNYIKNPNWHLVYVEDE